jgi:hypothetical protein
MVHCSNSAVIANLAKKPNPAASHNFSLGNDLPPPPPSTAAKPAASAAVAVVAAPAAPAAATPVAGKVGILVGGELATDSIAAAVSKALVLEGITGSVVSYANDVSIVAFAAKKLAAVCDVVIVASIIMDPTHTIAGSLRTTLAQVALTTDVPVIPALVVQDSLLEAKALLPALASSWAKAAASVLTMNSTGIVVQAAPEPVIVQPTVLTPAIEDAATLMVILRESLNVSPSLAALFNPFRDAWVLVLTLNSFCCPNRISISTLPHFYTSTRSPTEPEALPVSVASSAFATTITAARSSTRSS